MLTPTITANSNTDSNVVNVESIVNATLLQKSNALLHLIDHIDEQVTHAVELMFNCKGRVIISGMGKSGIVGKKMAATLASTGTPSYFVHPAEAFHGDLGMIRSKDVILLISNSGETEEVLKLMPSLKQFGNKIISLVNNPNSTMAKHADITLDIHVEKEACPNNLAPTTSTTVTLALTDALAIALMEKRNFQAEQFAVFHPGGSLGKRLLTKVSDVMVKDNLPLVNPQTNMHDVILTMTESTLGLAIVVENNALLGVITDGDLRRALASGVDLKKAMANDMFTAPVKTIQATEQLQIGEELMREAQVKHLVVVDDCQQVVGVLEFFQ
jgi:arabinose-5-phosphate isomerase